MLVEKENNLKILDYNFTGGIIMFCEQCGIGIEENKRFCPKCEEQSIKIIEVPKCDITSINGIKVPIVSKGAYK